MRERILLMGPPGSGKTHHLVRTSEYLKDKGITTHTIDMEDKIEAFYGGTVPKYLNLQVAIFWEELKTAMEKVESIAKPGDWVLVDRIDLSWPAVQRWFTQQKYKEELAGRMLETSKKMKFSSEFVPRFDEGSWQVINEAYETMMLKLLYKYRCNVLLTAGIRGVDPNSPQDIFGHLGVVPRGQKELGHQPNSVFLLTQRRAESITWEITTAKDMPNRDWFDKEPIFDFSLQYGARYWRL